MRFHMAAFSVACGVLWGGAIFLVGLSNLAWPGYGAAFLELAASIYPGYRPGSGIGSIVTGSLYGLVDGAIGGAIFALIYNFTMSRLSSGKSR